MRLLLPLSLLLVAAAPVRTALDTLTPPQAIARAAAAKGQPVRALFEFTVRSAHATKDGGYYLDSEADYKSPANLGVRITASAMKGIAAKYGADLGAKLMGRKVKLIGQVRQVAIGQAHATRLDVTHAGQLLSVS